MLCRFTEKLIMPEPDSSFTQKLDAGMTKAGFHKTSWNPGVILQ